MTVDYRIASDDDVPVMRVIFEEYANSLGIDLSYQNLAGELADLPGRYAPPEGGVIIAFNRGEPCGCVALRGMDAALCEMKHLYVRPDARGLGIGAELVKRVVEMAREKGYRSVRLDTLPSMKSAVSLCKLAGFKEIPAYIRNALPGTVFMEKKLR